MTSLNDYLRAEQPDKTEPASFYRPGATGWDQHGPKRKPYTGGDHEVELPEEPPLDTNDTDEAAAVADVTAALSRLEE